MAVEKAVAAPAASLATIHRFEKIVLSWDYLRLVRESTKKGAEVGTAAGLKSVKKTYKDVEEYIGVFEPLLFEEVKAQIVQGREEEDLTDWQKGAVASCAETDGFHRVSLAVLDEFREQVSENDILLLSKEKFQEGMTPSTYAFALVEQRGGRETLTLRTFLAGEVKHLDKAEPEHSQRLLRMLSVFKTTESFLWILKICSLSTIMREYVGLHSVASLPFKDLILSAAEKSDQGNLGDRAWNVPQPLMDYLQSNLNDSQLDAVQAGLSRRTFVLIQGPPGTGKTQTILGLLSAVLHSAPGRVQSKGGISAPKRGPELQIQDKYCHWIKASPWLSGANPRDLIMPIDGDDGFFPTGNELKPEIVNSNRKYRVHVLVCAPSNSALDEIVLRVLRTGIYDEYGHVYTPKIVRIGLKPHHSVQAVSMDYLVEQKLASVDRSSSGAGKQGSGGADRDRIRTSILDESAIVFSTLSFSGSSLFSKMNRAFDVVIIDEAAQAVEPSTLVPLAHGCRQVFLVGDPVQLPATVISSTAERFGYGTSLFKRFQKAGFPVQMLKIQYRMHPEISIFPSKEFYGGYLEDGESVKKTRSPWHIYRCFGPFFFFDIDGVESQPSGSGSWVNEEEVEFIALLYHKLASKFEDLKSSSQLAVISPYRHQVKLLRERFRATFGDQSDQIVDINTVDGFQGREKDIAIFSCVRANSGKGIGFVSDFRRMNVGITRARSSVLVVGSASTLMQDDHWKNLVKSAQDRKCYCKVTKPYGAFFNDANLDELKAEDPWKKKAKIVDELHSEMAVMENMAVDNVEGNAEGNEDYGMEGDGGGYDDD
ncbi:probable helicase MAGATAMA 3 isoform X2 [Phoenix dactylifera]|uniref:Probable helicase MAGATAMA 3 isoform X2 n=1 Tax=Phoenix dactylifera TaxID=42345 RepID=A0A8B7BM96_PHODC|nr:probable helicase MAGATAMA 3 isoform X2 [Phoenix dactylifera]